MSSISVTIPQLHDQKFRSFNNAQKKKILDQFCLAQYLEVKKFYTNLSESVFRKSTGDFIRELIESSLGRFEAKGRNLYCDGKEIAKVYFDKTTAFITQPSV